LVSDEEAIMQLQVAVPGYSYENWTASELHIPEDDWIQALEAFRREWHKQYPARTRDTRTLEQRAEAKRHAHKGGDINHRFEGERYVNCTDKKYRRMQLRKLVDEGGETSVGGERVSHPLLSRWESYGYGLTPEEIDALEKQDADPDALIARGWWVSANRTSHWAIAFGSSMCGEGGIAQRSKELMEGIAEDVQRLREWGVQDVDRTILNRWEHAGVDVAHAQMAYDVAQEYITTPEMREEMRRVFILRLQQQTNAV
jgi:pyrroloquinoline quinone (PQQ) biosynthesis protein C